MATYYLDYTNGLDANNGLGPDASHSTNKPWKTLGKVLASGSTVVPGDIIYVAPGMSYQGGQITVTTGIASSGSPTQIIGDPTNEQGFKTSGGVRVSPAPCWVTTRTAAEGMEGGYASSAVLMTASTAGTNGLQFKKLALESRLDSGLITLSPTTNADWLLEDCLLFSGAIITHGNTAATAGRNLTIRRCEITATQIFNTNLSTDAASAHADLNITVEHCFVIGRCSTTTALGTSTLAGGIRFKYNIFIIAGAGQASITTTASRISTTTPIRFEGNLTYGSNGPNAGTAGQVVSDGYNRHYRTGAPTNYTDAGTDLANPLLMLYRPSLVKWGLELPRPDFFGFTSLAASAQRFSGGTNTAADFWGRQVRPWGAGPSVGCFEYPDLTQGTDSQITGGGANYAKLTGQGEFQLPVKLNAAATTITVVTESSSYGGSSYPQAILSANPSIGVTEQTATATDATEQTLTIGPITPTAAGVAFLTLRSRSSSTTSITRFDRAAVAA